MSFYHPSDREFNRHYRAEFEMVLSGIDCVLHKEQVIYCSSELTTGSTFYRLLTEQNLNSASELKERLGKERYSAVIFQHNAAEAVNFAEAVRARFHDRTIVITPAPFTAPGWNQDEYLYFWETLLRTRVKSVWFNRNWEYSNGCTFEFAVALDAGLPTFDHNGNPIHRAQALELVRSAVEDLSNRGFDTKALRENLRSMGAESFTPA